MFHGCSTRGFQAFHYPCLQLENNKDFERFLRKNRWHRLCCNVQVCDSQQLNQLCKNVCIRRRMCYEFRIGEKMKGKLVFIARLIAGSQLVYSANRRGGVRRFSYQIFDSADSKLRPQIRQISSLPQKSNKLALPNKSGHGEKSRGSENLGCQ